MRYRRRVQNKNGKYGLLEMETGYNNYIKALKKVFSKITVDVNTISKDNITLVFEEIFKQINPKRIYIINARNLRDYNDDIIGDVDVTMMDERSKRPISKFTINMQERHAEIQNCFTETF